MRLHAFFQYHYFKYKRVLKELEEKALEKVLEQRRIQNKCRDFDSIYDYYKWYFLGIE